MGIAVLVAAIFPRTFLGMLRGGNFSGTASSSLESSKRLRKDWCGSSSSLESPKRLAFLPFPEVFGFDDRPNEESREPLRCGSADPRMEVFILLPMLTGGESTVDERRKGEPVGDRDLSEKRLEDGLPLSIEFEGS